MKRSLPLVFSLLAPFAAGGAALGALAAGNDGAGR